MDNQNEHVVFFPAADGSPAFRRYASLDEALRFVEHLHNVEEVNEAAVFALAPVPLAVRPYYRVEVAATPVPAPAPREEPAAAVPEPADPPVDEGEPAEAGAGGRRALGFFTH